MAVDRVEKRLRKVTAALDEAGIAYAVIDGNAVAAWVARVDPSATRATRDVDLLVRKEDLRAITEVMRSIRFERHDLRRLVLFTDPDEPSRRSGVHLIWANELIRPSYVCPSPDVTESELDPEGFRVVRLAALAHMKLTSNRDIDRVHIADLLAVGLLDESVRADLQPELLQRLEAIEATIEE